MKVTETQYVIGLDTDSHGFHAVMSGALAAKTSNLYTYRSKVRSAEIRRIQAFREERDFFKQLPPGCHIFCEEPLALKNGKTTRILGLMAGTIYGAMLAATDGKNLWWYWVDVAHWKKQVVGHGNANKDMVRQFCRSSPGFSYADDDLAIFERRPDLYDAWCLKTYGVRQLIGGGE
jgi:hypothetical protein